MANQPDEAFDLINNGTARIFVDGTAYGLRRPKVGEYKKLRELLHDTQDDIQARLLEDDEPKKLTKKKGGAKAAATDEVEAVVDDALAKVREARRLTRELNDFAESKYQDWIEEAVRMLGDKPLPPDRDNWPLFTTSHEFIAKLIEHWRSVPLALGGK